MTPSVGRIVDLSIQDKISSKIITSNLQKFSFFNEKYFEVRNVELLIFKLKYCFANLHANDEGSTPKI